MHSDLIGKIEKAKRYAQEPERFQLYSLAVVFHGDNHEHYLSLSDDLWSCDCTKFRLHHTCSHVMTLQRLLEPMLSAQARSDGMQVGPHSELISMVEKSRFYIHEPHRIQITCLKGVFHGTNNQHHLELADGTWYCDCETFRMRRTCAHVMALQKILEPMLPIAALESITPIAAEEMIGVLS
jgi:hypothetical protein